jgi:hypothetical protein
MTEAYPLRWPPGWPRHKGQRDSDRRFSGPTYKWDRVYKGLKEELQRIGASSISIVVSTNQPVRNDGLPYAQQRAISDPGVAVYFWRNKRAMVMAQDRFDTVIGNMRSLTMAIEGLRQMERHGGATMMNRAFDGFVALPPPEDWQSILGLRGQTKLNRDIVMGAFRAKAREGHANGADMDRLVKARDEALEKIGAS